MSVHDFRTWPWYLNFWYSSGSNSTAFRLIQRQLFAPRLFFINLYMSTAVEHATWHFSSCRSQEQQRLLSALQMFYWTTSFHATSCTSTTLWSSSHTSASLPSPFAATLNEISSLLLLGKPPEDSGTIYYAGNQLLAKKSISNTQRTTPKVPAPQQGCSTSHRGSEELTTLLALLLITDRDPFLKTSVPLPSQLSAKPSSWRLRYFLMHIKSPWNSVENFITQMEFWLRIALTTLNTPHQRSQHHIQGALLIKKNSE